MKGFTKIIILFFAFTLLPFTTTAQEEGKATAQAAALLNNDDIWGAITILDKSIAKKADFGSYSMRSTLRSMTGDQSGSFDDLNSAIEIKSDDPDLYERRAMARMNLRQESKLILKDLDSAIAYGKKLVRIYRLRAHLRRTSGDEKGALEDYNEAIALRPDDAGSYVGLASIYALNGETDKETSLLENFISAYENLESNIGKKNPSASLGSKPIVASIVPLHSEPKKGTLEMETVLMTKSGTNSGRPSREEMERMNQEMEDTKNIALAYTALAAAYCKKADYERALATVEKSITIDNTDFYAFETRGKIRVGMGDFQNAIGNLSASIRSYPKNPPVYLERGIAYMMVGKEAESQKDFTKYLELFPNGAETLKNRIEKTKVHFSK